MQHLIGIGSGVRNDRTVCIVCGFKVSPLKVSLICCFLSSQAISIIGPKCNRGFVFMSRFVHDMPSNPASFMPSIAVARKQWAL